MTPKGLYKDIILPYEVTYEKSSYQNSYAKFHVYPFDRGVGVTVANSLRRVLLSAISGYAISGIKVSNIRHEFEYIPGMKEDLVSFILALKKVNLLLVDGAEKALLHVHKKGAGAFCAGDLAVDSNVTIVNPDLHLATLNEDADFSMEVYVDFGRGYHMADEVMAENDVMFLLPIDALYSPVERVNFQVSDYRVKDKTDCEQITFEVWTNGTLDPIDAFGQAAAILRKYFSVFVNFEEQEVDVVFAEPESQKEDVLDKVIEDLDLNVRAHNCLSSANIRTIGDLLEHDIADLMKIKNFGRKTLDEISAKLAPYQLELKGTQPVEDDEG